MSSAEDDKPEELAGASEVTSDSEATAANPSDSDVSRESGAEDAAVAASEEGQRRPKRRPSDEPQADEPHADEPHADEPQADEPVDDESEDDEDEDDEDEDDEDEDERRRG